MINLSLRDICEHEDNHIISYHIISYHILSIPTVMPFPAFEVAKSMVTGTVSNTKWAGHMLTVTQIDITHRYHTPEPESDNQGRTTLSLNPP